MRPTVPFLAVLFFLGSLLPAAAQTQQSAYGFLTLGARTHKLHAIVSWETIQELTITEFRLQQSSDGQHFRTVGQLPASHDTTKLRHSYSITLPNAGAGVSVLYYRLEIGVNNGRTLYSKTFPLRFTEAVEPALVIQPNVVSGTLPLRIESDYEGAAQLQVFDPAGGVAYTEGITLSKGLQLRSADAARLRPGLYVAVITAPGLRLQQRFFRR
ncbi:hypothetical protein [Flaviaesturariibacter amylovorans]|uniref:T9SS type A sorting domain-containing protein n=1 Tax=Flaviaesturariibacter amylovorans TaxID=1084520 RepID=A0ABP8G4J4_9BACT